MEILDSVWQISIIAMVAGIMIGALAYRLFGPSTQQSDKVREELEAARDELNSYKAEVSQHFDKTSELVGDLTQNYVKVYQHLAEGSQSLGDSKNLIDSLEQHRGRVSIAVEAGRDGTQQGAEEIPLEPAVTEPSAAEPVDEHAEPFVTPATVGPDSVTTDSVKKAAGDDISEVDESTTAQDQQVASDIPESSVGDTPPNAGDSAATDSTTDDAAVSKEKAGTA